MAQLLIVIDKISSGASIMPMSTIQKIRTRLDLTRTQMAEALDVTVGNIAHYEVRGQVVPPKVAGQLIAFAHKRGVPLTFDDVYADDFLPRRVQRARRQPAATG